MISCQICGANTHHIGRHLERDHADVTLEDYTRRFPDAPLYSEAFLERMKTHQAEQNQSAVTVGLQTEIAPVKRLLQEVFCLGDKFPIKNARGEPIEVLIVDQSSTGMVPKPDYDYIFDVEKLKSLMFGLEQNIPIYVWGPAGTGKSALIRNLAAFTTRAFYRVQHTLNMIEADVLGDWRAKDGNTYFELGPLPTAMLNGWMYLADEYDRAPPGVVSLYQAVLEGEPLILKEAPAHQRRIDPHPQFRICATGNTSGTVDETGLYAGTVVQDAANYSRFGITEYIGYMEPEYEINLLVSKASLRQEDAKLMVTWAGKIRELFRSGRMMSTVGPRELLYAAKVGAYFYDFRRGLRTAITNRMSETDREAAEQLAQRYFG